MTKKLTISITIISAVILVFSGCAKKPVVNQNINQNANQSINQNISINQNQNVNLNATTNTNTNQPAVKPNITLTKDPDGWMTYTNYDWGIRFRFEDEEGRTYTKMGQYFNKDNDNNGILNIYKTTLLYYNDKNEQKKYGSLADYIVYLKNGNIDDKISSYGYGNKFKSYIQLKYPNIAEAYEVKFDFYIGSEVQEERTQIYIAYPDNNDYYIHVDDYKEPITKQMLSTFEFLH